MTLSANQTAVLAAIHAVAGDGTTPTASFDVPGLSRRQLAHVFAQLRDKGLIRGSGPVGARHVELTAAGAAALDPTQESQDLAPALEASIAAVAAAAPPLPEPDLAKAIATISTLTARIADLEAQIAARAPRTPRPAGSIRGGRRLVSMSNADHDSRPNRDEAES